MGNSRGGGWGPALVDPEVAVAIAYGVYGAPEAILIGRDGTIVEKVTGAVNGPLMRREEDARVLLESRHPLLLLHNLE